MSGDLSIDLSEFNLLFVHSAVDDYPLTPEEFRVYGHIARRAGGNQAWPSIKSVAKKCGMHEDTARAALKNLVAFRMLIVEERGHLGLTNLYKIASASQWLSHPEAIKIRKAQEAAGKAKRAARREAKAAAQSDPLRNEGTPLKRRDPPETKGGGASETKGGEGGETKGDEVYPLKVLQEGSPKEREAAAPPALSGHTQEPAEPEHRPAPEQQAADAAAPDGAGPDLPVPSQVQPTARASQNGNATSSKKVPGGAARRGAPQTTEDYLRRLLSSQFVDSLLTEIQPLGVNRGADWFALPMEHVEELVAEAQRTHVAHKVKVPTRMKDLLDEECRRRNTPVTPEASSKYDRSNWSD